MSSSKRKFINIILVLALIFLSSGCAVFTEGKNKLNQYCPGLKINFTGVSSVKMELKKAFILDYDDVYVKNTEIYLMKNGKDYSPAKPSDFSEITIHNEPVIREDDYILAKIIQGNKGTTKVIFDETRPRIIIIEYRYTRK